MSDQTALLTVGRTLTTIAMPMAMVTMTVVITTASEDVGEVEAAETVMVLNGASGVRVTPSSSPLVAVFAVEATSVVAANRRV